MINPDRISGNEKINDISNLYGLDEEYLLAINKMDYFEELEEGSLIKLKSGGIKYNPNKSKMKEAKDFLVDNSIYLFDKALEPLKQ